jgi:hypothetical protein
MDLQASSLLPLAGASISVWQTRLYGVMSFQIMVLIASGAGRNIYTALEVPFP